MLFTVVIPVYNTEKYLKRCIDSVLQQSYRDIEVIVVNDFSPGNCDEIVEQYMDTDSRIKYIKCEKNLGLFHARLEGAKAFTGDYITFLDSDDFWGLDLVRRYVEACRVSPDIVCCNFSIVENDIYYEYPNLELRSEQISGEEVRNRFFRQAGYIFSYHTIWNKCYSRELWEKSLPLLNMYNAHLIMGEDIVFSSVFVLNVSLQVNIQYCGVYYVKNNDACTYNDLDDVRKLDKNLNDISSVLNFVEKNVISLYSYGWVERQFKIWKDLYARIWNNNINNCVSSNYIRKRKIERLKSLFGIEKLFSTAKADHFAYINKTTSIHQYEELVSTIDNYKVISFDLFDTLISRRTLFPTDVHRIVEAKAKASNTLPKNFKFEQFRVDAEQQARQKLNSLRQECTLNEIYDEMKCVLSEKVLNKIKIIELNVEYDEVLPRKEVLELLNMALYLGKEVCIVTDIYFDEKFVEKLLGKIGVDISQPQLALFVSSEYKMSKNIGGLYDIVAKQYKFARKDILHIGDNHHSDEVLARQKGFAAYGVKKSVDLIMGETPFYEGDVYKKIVNSSYPINGQCEIQYNCLRAVYAVISNNLFQSPFINCPPHHYLPKGHYGVGFGALGPHIWAVTWWLMDIVQDSHICFIARDGYCIRKVYQQIRKTHKADDNSSYLEISRRAIISGILAFEYPEIEILSLVDYRSFTPLQLFNVLLPKEANGSIPKEFISTTNFSTSEELLGVFRKICFNTYYKAILLDQARGIIDYIKTFNINDSHYFFDIGYSGTTISYIQKISGAGSKALFIHTNDDSSKSLCDEVHTFYNTNPCVQGAMREFPISSAKPTVTHYLSDGTPQYACDLEMSTSNKIIASQLQDGVCDFVNEMELYWNDYSNFSFIRYQSISLLWDNFLNNLYSGARCDFDSIQFEDIVTSTMGQRSIVDDWPVLRSSANTTVKNLCPSFMDLNDLSVPKRVMYGIFVDHKDLVRNIKRRLSHYFTNISN